MPPTRIVAAFATFVLAAASAQAQPLSGLDDPEANIVAELVVQAKEPGPAWWRVKDADTTVWILGVGDDKVPADLAWDRRALQRRLTGAHTLILGARVNIRGGVRDLPALLRARKQLRSRTPVEETMPEPLRARFVAARERIGRPAARYAGWGQLVAGRMLLADSREERKTVSVSEQIQKEARRRGVRVAMPATYKAGPMMQGALDAATPAVNQACLEGALADIEAPPALGRAAARGWARGDVAAALTEPRGFDKCILLLAGGQSFWRRVVDDQTHAIAQALEKPGHAVAVMSLRQLLAQDGVVARLEARGARVLGPGEAD